jgi:lipopolysaccharide/colanic/teichoic acid biosynthesis glycosyltransferase
MKNPAGLKGEQWINSPYKRSMDLLIAGVSIPAASTIGATALGLSRMIDGRGAVFKHQRLGQNGERFTIAKIRTLKDIEPDVVNKGVADEHATAFGRMLRLRGIDEIPQITNVLAGEMSVVGPRAMPQSGIDHMQEVLPRNEFDEWLEIYSLSKPGGISSFGLHYRMNDQGLRHYEHRAMMDKSDFENTSLLHDINLVRRAAAVGIKLFFSSTPRNSELSLEYEAGNT